MAGLNKVTTLSNGMRVVTQSMPHVKTISMGVWVDVGSRYEEEREGGIAHFLEHMAFKGTKTRSAFDIVREIEAVGGDLNAATSQETTSYFVTLLQEDWRLGVDVLSDIVQNSIFPQEEIARERDVVLQEVDQTEDAPDEVVFELAQKVAFPNQALGRPILGTKENIRAFDQKTLNSFVDKHYTGDRLVFSAAGCVDHDALVEVVEKAFQTVRSAEVERVCEKGVYQGGDASLSKPLEQKHIVFGFEGVPITDPRFYTIQCYANLLGGGMASRLFQEVREKRGLVYGISAFAPSYRDTGLFCVYTSTSQSSVKDIIEIVQEEIQKTACSVTEEELNRSKNQMKANFLVAREGTAYCMSAAARQLLYGGRLKTPEEIIQTIDDISRLDIKVIVEAILKSPSITSYVGPRA